MCGVRCAALFDERTQLAQHAFEDCHEELFLVAKVIVERRLGHADGIGDLAHRDGVIPFFYEEALGGAKDRRPGVGEFEM